MKYILTKDHAWFKKGDILIQHTHKFNYYGKDKSIFGPESIHEDTIKSLTLIFKLVKDNMARAEAAYSQYLAMGEKSLTDTLYFNLSDVQRKELKKNAFITAFLDNLV